MQYHSRAAAVASAAAIAFMTIAGTTRLTAATTPLESAARHCKNATQCLSVTNQGTGSAVAGLSAAGIGLAGTTRNRSTKDNYGSEGVAGIDAAKDGGQQNIGVQGVSATSNGVEGVTTNPSLTEPFARAAVFGIDASTDGGQRNWGTAGYSKNGTGILGLSFAPAQMSGGPFTPALLAVCGNGGPSIEAADGPFASNNLFLLADCSGNLTIAGTLTTGAPPVIATKRMNGPDVGAYAPREAVPTIEDVGRATLVSGRADVAFQRDFAATIARDASYLVLITPEGDSRGLYIAGRTNQGFEVRESEGGRSSISFAYRIVARPLGAAEPRFPAISTGLVRSPRTHVRRNALDLARLIGAVRPSLPH